MRTLVLTLAAVLSVGAARADAPVNSVQDRLIGDYVEARTASVFAGACHYNGEVTTTGCEAEMVWHFREGAWGGTSFSGLNALAAVTSEANLGDENARHRTVLYIDARATDAQAAALVNALKTSYGRSLGTVEAVKRAAIAFDRADEKIRVEAKLEAKTEAKEAKMEANVVSKLIVEAMPDRACCKQPNLVWYKPLIELTNRRVGYTQISGIQDRTAGTPWSISGQNTAFYGTFTR